MIRINKSPLSAVQLFSIAILAASVLALPDASLAATAAPSLFADSPGPRCEQGVTIPAIWKQTVPDPSIFGSARPSVDVFLYKNGKQVRKIGTAERPDSVFSGFMEYGDTVSYAGRYDVKLTDPFGSDYQVVLVSRNFPSLTAKGPLFSIIPPEVPLDTKHPQVMPKIFGLNDDSGTNILDADTNQPWFPLLDSSSGRTYTVEWNASRKNALCETAPLYSYTPIFRRGLETYDAVKISDGKYYSPGNQTGESVTDDNSMSIDLYDGSTFVANLAKKVSFKAGQAKIDANTTFLAWRNKVKIMSDNYMLKFIDEKDLTVLGQTHPFVLIPWNVLQPLSAYIENDSGRGWDAASKGQATQIKVGVLTGDVVSKSFALYETAIGSVCAEDGSWPLASGGKFVGKIKGAACYNKIKAYADGSSPINYRLIWRKSDPRSESFKDIKIASTISLSQVNAGQATKAVNDPAYGVGRKTVLVNLRSPVGEFSLGQSPDRLVLNILPSDSPVTSFSIGEQRYIPITLDTETSVGQPYGSVAINPGTIANPGVLIESLAPVSTGIGAIVEINGSGYGISTPNRVKLETAAGSSQHAIITIGSLYSMDGQTLGFTVPAKMYANLGANASLATPPGIYDVSVLNTDKHIWSNVKQVNIGSINITSGTITPSSKSRLSTIVSQTVTGAQNVVIESVNGIAVLITGDPVIKTPAPTPRSSASPSPSVSPSPVITIKVSPTPSPTMSTSPAITVLPTPGATPGATPRITPSPTPTTTSSPSPTPSNTSSPTPAPTSSSSPSPKPTPTATPIQSSPSPTPTSAGSPTPTPTPSPTPTNTSPTPSATPTPASSPTPTPTPTSAGSPTPTPSPSPSPNPSPVAFGGSSKLVAALSYAVDRGKLQLWKNLLSSIF